MKTPEQIKELKQVSIVGYLRGKGINPISKSGSYFMYHSPLRNDSTSSFSVNPTKNTFYDLGNDSDKGNIIELVMRMERMGFAEACQYLDNSQDLMKENEKPIFLSLSPNSNNETKNYEVTAVKDLQHPALIRYVESRKISLHTAFSYLKEIHYKNAKGKFFGVGYQNDSGGYVLRSEIMKKPINLGHTGIKTFVIAGSNNISVFEGMFDFLSAIEYHNHAPKCTAIVLNSLSNLSKALPLIQQAQKVFIYFDRDENQAGQKATAKLVNLVENCQDMSHIYQNFNDFNDFLTNKSSIDSLKSHYLKVNF
jgi:DNA primase